MIKTNLERKVKAWVLILKFVDLKQHIQEYGEANIFYNNLKAKKELKKHPLKTLMKILPIEITYKIK